MATLNMWGSTYHYNDDSVGQSVFVYSLRGTTTHTNITCVGQSR